MVSRSGVLPARDVRVVLVGTMFALFLAALEQTIVATALPRMLADVGHVELSAWVMTSYLVSAVCATPVLGKLSDMYGRGAVMRVCLALFAGGSVLCAAAPGMAVLIAGRAVQGLGGGGLITLAQAIVGDAVSPRERGRYAGYFSVAWMSAALIGPVAGGLLAQHAGWRWIFWVNLPLGALAWLLTERALSRLPSTRRAAHVDVVGILLLCTASIALLACVTFPVRAARGDPVMVGLVAFAIVTSAAFMRRQRSVPEPILPPHFLRDPVIAPVLAAAFLVFGSYLSLIVLVPLYLQVGTARSAGAAGLLLVPMMLTSSVSALLAGRYTRASGRYRPPPMVSLPLAIAAAVAIAMVAPAGNGLAVAALAALFGLGVGTAFPSCIVAAQAAAGPRDTGVVSGAVGLARALGAALMTGLAIAWVLAIVSRALPRLANVESLEALVQRPLDAATRAIVADAFSSVMWLLAASLTLGWLAFRRLEDRTLEHVALTARPR